MTDLEPDSDPTPVYKGIGVFLLLCSVALTAYAFVVGRSIDRWTAAVIALPVVATLVLWRPKWVKWFIETAADKLPFVAFKKAPPA
jgi:hypothetical protein